MTDSQKLDLILKSTKMIESDVGTLKQDVSMLKDKTNLLEDKLDSLQGSVERLEGRVSGLESNAEKTESRLLFAGRRSGKNGKSVDQCGELCFGVEIAAAEAGERE